MYAIHTFLEWPSYAGDLVIVTGSNTGIGFTSCEYLAKAGLDVVLASRSVAKGEAAKEHIQGNVQVLGLDCSSLKSVETFVKEFKAMKGNRRLHAVM